MSPIENVLKGRHFSVVGFWGMHTIAVVHIIIEVDSQEYNTDLRAIRQRAQAPDRKWSRGQALFCSWILGGAHYQHR